MFLDDSHASNRKSRKAPLDLTNVGIDVPCCGPIQDEEDTAKRKQVQILFSNESLWGRSRCRG